MRNSVKAIRVTLKAAISLDGKIACSNGDSKWITSNAARLEAHRLRCENDMILIGINTVLKDDPSLNVRGIEGGKSPVRVILDSHARLPSWSRVLVNDGIKIIHVTGNESVSTFLELNHNLENLQSPSPRPDIEWLLDHLQQRGYRKLLVEGGGEVHASFIKSGFVSELHLFIAPKIIGGQNARSWCAELGIKKVADSNAWNILSIEPVGQDFHLIAEPS
jgi:diaminohydroxyphosphoribosylaminopyrimidine deaminase / 5-amino-6-(5-phosphoribosylamino)uracil reductase